MPLLFLYGTLMRGGVNHAVLARLHTRFVGEAKTRDRRTLVDLGPYPAIVSAATRPDASSCVTGELWDVDDEALAELDIFEGVPDLYAREYIELDHDGSVVAALTYVFVKRLPASARVLSSGRYDVGSAAIRRASRGDRHDD